MGSRILNDWKTKAHDRMRRSVKPLSFNGKDMLIRPLFSLFCSMCLGAMVWAQSVPLGSFTDGQSMTIQLQQGPSGLQGSMAIMGMDEQIPMQISQQGSVVVATANLFGEVLQFTLAPSGNNLMVGAGGEQALFQRVGSAPVTPPVTPPAMPPAPPPPSVPGMLPNSSPPPSSAPQAQISSPPMSPPVQGDAKPSKVSAKLDASFLAEVKERYEGYAFKPLKDWKGGKNEKAEAYVYGHDVEAGWLILYSDKSTDNTAQKYQQWIGAQLASIQEGVSMRLMSSCQSHSQEVVYCDFSGTDQAGTPLRAIAAAKIVKGRLLSVTSFTTKASFNQGHVDRTIALASSARFFTPEPPPKDQTWIEDLGGRKLTYMSSSSSSGYDGSSTSSSTRDSYGFCPNGTFYQTGSDSYSVSAGQGSGSQTGSGSSAMGSGSGRSEGRWTVLKKGNRSILELTYSNGNVAELEISVDEDWKTYLDGTRYFKTGGTYGQSPDCP